MVNSVTGSGDIIVCYNSDVRFNLNKNAVKKVGDHMHTVYM